ncbi:MAG: pyridoxamine 5'-phosphate oxidase family protein [Candidatus Promineifilaceae bacterium]
MSNKPQSDLSRVRRLPKRGHYDQETLYAILDSAMVCHVGFNEGDQPVIIPTLVAREGNKLLLHGSSKSRMMQVAAAGKPICITVTHFDGIVLARSAFHHSVNYRSAVFFGTCDPVTDYDEKMRALAAFTDKLIPGRWDDCRQPTPNEVKATAVVAMEIGEASAKIRAGGPGDDDEDYALPIWAGVLPITQTVGEPIDDPLLREGIPVPEYVKDMVTAQS